MSTAADLVLGPLLASDAGAPLVTYYELESGARIELSVTSTANWAAKIAGLVRDECLLYPGGRMLLDLPLHWLTPAVLLGAWWAGAHVCTPGAPGRADIVGADAADPTIIATTADRLSHHDPTVETLVVSTDPMGRSLDAIGMTVPTGVTDLVAASRIQPDAFIPGGAATACLDGRTPKEVRDGQEPGRVLLPWDGETSPIPALARLLLAGCSIVAVRGAAGADPARLDEIAATEKIVARA